MFKIGYTQGVFDMFHIGHLNLINRAKEQCEVLIVGVNADALVKSYKHKTPVIGEAERAAIVRNIKAVDRCEVVTTLDKEVLYQKYGFDAVFIGDDWKGDERWAETERVLAQYDVPVVYLPHTPGETSTLLRGKADGQVNEDAKITIDKDYCMSSYLTFRYVYDPNVWFREGLPHHDHALVPDEEKTPCETADDIDRVIRETLAKIDLRRTALMISGGMDSAILASYLPPGTKCYTANCIGRNAVDETKMARTYCDLYQLEHVIVDVTWDDYRNTMDELMLSDGSPIAPNQPQAYKIARKALKDGATHILYGDCADTEFGGMTLLLSKDWTFDGFVERYTFIRPETVLKSPKSVLDVYEKYRKGADGIDFISFVSEVYAKSAAGALSNACRCAGIAATDPYEKMKMAKPLDLARVRRGESKYLIRDLFRKRYPTLAVPEKLPMSRPAADWMQWWEGPVRDEFIPSCADNLTGEQRLLLYFLERFLNLIQTPKENA